MADWYVSSAAWNALPQFAASTAYTVGQIIRPLTAPAVYQQFSFRCTTAGTSGTEPSWATAAGNNNTVTSGGATFTNVSGQPTYNWTAPIGNLNSVFSGSAPSGRGLVGDRVFVSSDHSETLSSLNFAPNWGTAAFGAVQVISVNRAGSVPPAPGDALSGATFINSSGTITLDAHCSVYWQGVTFNQTANGFVYFGNNGNKQQYFKNCSFVMSGTAAASAKLMTVAFSSKIVLDNSTITFNNAGQGFGPSGSATLEVIWINTPSAIAGTVPTALFTVVGSYGWNLATLRGVDLSALTTAILLDSANGSVGKILLDSCRIASGVTRYSATFAVGQNSNDEVELVNCYDGTNLALSERHTPAGDLTTNRTITMVGGAQDDVGLFSHQMVSSSRSDLWAMPLESFWLDVEDTLTGTAHTATVQIVSSASLNNTDIALVVEYLGTASSSVASFVSTITSSLTPSSALPTSSQTWNSPPSTPVYQALQVSFTAQQAGRLRAQVRLGKPSTTVYVNPQIVVT